MTREEIIKVLMEINENKDAIIKEQLKIIEKLTYELIKTKEVK